MPTRSPFPKKKSRLSSTHKALVAAHAVYLAVHERKSPADLGLLLRAETGVQWTFLSAVQFLTGKEAVTSILALPSDFMFRGLSKQQLLSFVDLANDFAANGHPDGTPMTAGSYLAYFRRPT